MGKFKSGLVAAMLWASVSGSALATEVGQFYGAIDVGQGKLKDGCTTVPGITIISCSDSDTAFRGAIGYQLHPNVAVEASYANYGTVEARFTDGVDTIDATAKTSGFQFSAIGSWPLADAFSVTGKLGLALTKGETAFPVGGGASVTFDDNSTTFAYGIGARYDINTSIAVRAQYESLGKISFDKADPTAVDDLTLISAGVIFSF